jgi:hypothetical protein
VGDDHIHSILDFIHLNTPVNHFKFGFEDSDHFSSKLIIEHYKLIGEALKFNYQLLSISGHFPLPKYYLERNKKLVEMDLHFTCKMTKVKCFDFYFEFQ